jgi:outer membrane protein assembly factor BamB
MKRWSPVRPRLLPAAALSLLLAGAAPAANAPGFRDPAPPKLPPLAKVPAPAPQKQAGLKFHAAPKPLPPKAVTHDWCTFLGPAHNGISTEKPLLRRFGKNGPPIVWEVAKGEGFATPAVVGQRVVLFHRLEANEVVECLQAETGRRFWKYAYPTGYRDRYGSGDGPRCPPVSDGTFVYTFGVEGKLHCLKLATGQVVWKRDIVREFKLSPNFFGVGSTPLIEGKLLIVNVGAPGGPCVAAFDKQTGKMVWGAGKQWGPSYASPIPATVRGQRRIFVFAGGESRPATGGLLCIDPANGKVLFRFPWRGTPYESVNASSPVVIGNQVYISECYGAGGVLLDVLPNGSCRKVWTNPSLSAHFMTPIYKDGYLYGISGHGPRNAPIVCVDARTGKEMWRAEPNWEEMIPSAQGQRKVGLSPGLASMILVDGRCLMLGDSGHLVWLDLNPKGYRELERVRLFLAPDTWGMPALSRGLLYVCENNHGADGTPQRLICYDLRGTR